MHYMTAMLMPIALVTIILITTTVGTEMLYIVIYIVIGLVKIIHVKLIVTMSITIVILLDLLIIDNSQNSYIHIDGIL